jgi:hypothetical protein
MNLVSSFLENILTIEEGPGPEAGPGPGAKGATEVPGAAPEGAAPKGTGPKEATATGTGGAGADGDGTDGTEGKRGSRDYSFWPDRRESDASASVAAAGAAGAAGVVGAAGAPAARQSVLADKLMEKMLAMVIPVNASTSGGQTALNERLGMQKTRPALLVNVMTKNSIQLVQRLLAVFAALDAAVRFCLWRSPAYTLALLLAATHLILRPVLLTVVPLAYVLFAVMVPHYMAVYAPERVAHLARNPVPALLRVDRPTVPHPVPELSREFIVNLTDLQNYMLVYVVAFDWITWVTRDYLYFVDEEVLSLVFLAVAAAMAWQVAVFPRVLPVVVAHVPIRLGLVAALWAGAALLHPAVRNKVLEWAHDEETRLWAVLWEMRVRRAAGVARRPPEAPEAREAEIFEVQRLAGRVWEAVGFSPDFFSVNNPHRKLREGLFAEPEPAPEAPPAPPELESDAEAAAPSYHIPLATQLADIKPPVDWEFRDRWKLDLDVSEWVARNYISDVVHVDTDEKWVYDVLTPEELGDAHGKHEFFRRRRWVRACAREDRRAERGATREGEPAPPSFAEYLL